MNDNDSNRNDKEMIQDSKQDNIKTSKENAPKRKRAIMAFDEMFDKSLSEIIKRHKQENPHKWDDMLRCENYMKEEIGLQEFEMLKIECNKWLDASLQPWINEKLIKDCSSPRLAKIWFFTFLQQISSYNLTETQEEKDQYK